MISIDNISIAFNGTDLFSQVSFLIDKKDKIGLVGKNGAGKSTLLKVLIGQQNTDSGNISKSVDLKLGYLPQQMTYQSGKTVAEEAETAFKELNTIQKDLDDLNMALAAREDYESEAYAALIQKIAELTDALNIHGAHNTQEKLEKVLMGLGFLKTDFARQTDEFSGGWRMRIELAKILLQEPDVLLLDEPTNHLDIESIQWLETFLKNYGGAIVLISHDRQFLDTITNRTIEISLGKIYDYKTSYTNYVEQRKERREQQIAAYKNQQKKIEETEAFINRFRYQATKAIQVQSRIKQLEKMERIEIEEEDHSAVNIKFQPSPRSGNLVIEAKKLGKSFDDHVVLKDLEFTIERGEKIAFVGKNGEGKTTLSKMIIGEHEYSGLLKIGHNVKIGYFAQNQDELLDKKKTVFQTLDDIAVGEIRKKLRDILGAFLFRGEDIDKKVSVLSGGEQSRLALAKLLLDPVNLLVMDEPTNHLDLLTKDILKNALKLYDGTLLIVSHDRYFLDGLCDKIYEFKNQNIREHLSGIQDFIKKKQIDDLNQLNEKKQALAAEKPQEQSDQKLSYEERKQIDKQIRKIKKDISACEDQINESEEAIKLINDELATQSDQFTPEDFQEKYKTVETHQQTLEQSMHKWEQLNYELEIVLEQRGLEN
jgi:ATP-binding cassette subfamily F protein 3